MELKNKPEPEAESTANELHEVEISTVTSMVVDIKCPCIVHDIIKTLDHGDLFATYGSVTITADGLQSVSFLKEILDVVDINPDDNALDNLLGEFAKSDQDVLTLNLAMLEDSVLASTQAIILAYFKSSDNDYKPKTDEGSPLDEMLKASRTTKVGSISELLNILKNLKKESK